MSDNKETPNTVDEKLNTITASAQGGAGGAGGQAMTYVDNYSALMLMYMYLLDSKNGKKLYKQRQSLLPLLESVLNLEKEYRSQMLEAIKSNTST